MNIVFFSDTYLPHKNGVTNAMLLEKKELEAKGHKVYIISVGSKQAEDRQEVLRIRSLPFVGVHTKQPFRIGIFDRARIDNFLSDKKIDLIHTHTEFSLGWLGHYFARKLGVPHVHTWHTMWEEYKNVYFITRLVLPFPLLRKLLTSFLSRVNLIATPTQKSANYVKKLVPKANVHLLQNGIPFAPLRLTQKEKLQERKKRNIPENAVLALFAGRITSEKRVDELFRIFLLAMDRAPNLYLILAGDGGLSDTIKEKLARSPYYHRIFLPGFLPLTDIAVLNSIADITTSASLSETSNMSLLEGMASGCAVLARNDECLIDVVENEKGGYVCKDDLEMVWRLIDLANNKEKTKKFGEYNQSIAERFSARTHVQNLLKLYTSALQAKK